MVSFFHQINLHNGLIWIFVTENIIWSKPDKERAFSQNIRIITERELRYYHQIADHLKKAARYQFLAEFLKDQKIPGLGNTKIPAIRGKLGGEYFYCFLTTPRQLLKISFVNHRSLNDPDGAPTYQRLISRVRMRQIGNFLKMGGYFPTNLLINFTRSVRFDKIMKDEDADVTYGQLYLPDRYRSAWIIDGQHRLYGFAPLEDNYLDQNIIVIAFENISHEEEANLFVTINHEQKSVPKTLLDDLEGELKWGSKVPSERIGAIGARLIGLLNNDIGEPFYNRITQQGIKATEKTCLTIPYFKAGLRKSGLIGLAIIKRKVYEPGPLSGTNDSDTLDRARRAINHFFSCIRESNSRQWDMGKGGHLCVNVGIQAYLNLFAELIRYMEVKKSLDSREIEPEEIILELQDYLNPIIKYLSDASDPLMGETFKVQFGSGGPREYYFRLCKIVNQVYNDFIPEGFAEWQEEQSQEKIDKADKQIKDLNSKIQSFIFRVFHTLYGDKSNAYWEKGVVSDVIKTKAYNKSLEDEFEKRLPLENYLEFIDYKKIIEHKTHWRVFKPVFNIPDPDVKGVAKNLKWMERLNELRRIPAHSTESRLYKAEDFEYLNYIYDEFIKRLSQVNINEIVYPDSTK